jgi:hypothetical protein
MMENPDSVAIVAIKSGELSFGNGVPWNIKKVLIAR